MKFTDNTYFCLFYLNSFQKYLRTFLRGNLLIRMSQNVYWPCRTSRGLFLLAHSCFGEFLLTWGQRFTVSVKPWFDRGGELHWNEKHNADDIPYNKVQVQNTTKTKSIHSILKKYFIHAYLSPVLYTEMSETHN